MALIKVNQSHIANVTFGVDPALVEPHVPEGTELSTRYDEAYVSLIGYDVDGFQKWGIPIPFSFSVLLLRFYVEQGDRKGFVNVQKFVPKQSVAFVTEMIFGEPCGAQTMGSSHREEGDRLDFRLRIKLQIHREKLEVNGHGPIWKPDKDSPEYWVINRNWGFVSQDEGPTKYYRAGHPNLELYHIEDFECTIAYEAFFGEEWSFLVEEEPITKFLAKGTTVNLGWPQEL